LITLSELVQPAPHVSGAGNNAGLIEQNDGDSVFEPACHARAWVLCLSLSELSDMFQNYLSLGSVINGCIGNGKRNPRIFAMPA
jgi:hypothetical protein